MKKQERINSSSSQSTDKSFYIENLGCAKNQVDAETVSASLEKAGWVLKSDPEEAALIIVNTCGFIGPAKEESIDTTLSFRQRFPEKKLILAGCLAERYGKELYDGMPDVDGIFGNQAPGAITGIAEEVYRGNRTIDIPEHGTGLYTRNHLFSFPGSGYVKISEGCSNSCSYCAIPIIRGTLRSRGIPDLVDEIRELLDRGIQEIVLIAQDLGSYGNDTGGPGLTGLLESILSLKGDFWLRMLYIHPDHFPGGILDTAQRDHRVLPYFDIPFQHASAGILKNMNRSGDSGMYLRLVESIRNTIPGAVIRSTFLLGFPGETGDDVLELKAFIREARLDWAGFFAYSREEDTPAYSLVSEREYRHSVKDAEERIRELQEIQERITEDRLERYTGTELPVLLEEKIEGEPVWLGRAFFSAPEVDGLVVIKTDAETLSFTPGKRVPVRIIRRNGVDLEAVPVAGPGM